jgi:uncharacterized protein YjbI with pentapeptide repeats
MNNTDFPISRLYDGTEELEFVHGSVRDFFLAEYLYQSIKGVLTSKQTENERINIARRFGEILQYNEINGQTKEFLYYKIQYHQELDAYYNAVENTFNLMLEDGMMYYCSKNMVKKILSVEQTVFFNMLIVIHGWELPEKRKIQIRHYDEMVGYLNCCHGKGYLDLSMMSMQGIVLVSLYAFFPNLRFTNLSNANLSNANLSNADMSNTNLQEADMFYANLQEANLSNADLTKVILRNANLQNANLCNVKLRRSDLSGADLRYVDLSGADLSYADLSGANLSYADLSGADLGYADLSGADLSFADLGNADLFHTDLQKANLRSANLCKADLIEANLREANLCEANLSNIIIFYATSNKIRGCTFDDHNIQQVKDLENIEDAYVWIHKTRETLTYLQYIE